MRCFLIFETILLDLEISAPMRTNGMPMPIEYANNKLNAIPGVVVARVIIVPKIGPTHGVHPAANAIPNKNETGNLTPVLFGNIFLSTLECVLITIYTTD